MSFVLGLKCRECGREYPKQPTAGCEDCFAPLKVDYDYDAISNIYVDGEDVRFLDKDTRVPDGAEVSIVPAISGG